MSNTETIRFEAGLGFEHIGQYTVFLTEISDFAVGKEIYAEAIDKSLPARSAA
ncbi:Rid family hydrolase [Epibacterium ulvae]|uniref:Rid family hydrolase n=1 Tax=Epibacterium ulvae TaxID=1156985 RepID=UPI002490222C|nr:Rid family hydrolase [Epibacterium ulvae]